MTTMRRDPLVDDYLRRLEAAAAHLPRARRTELVGEIEEHVEAGLAEAGDDEPGGRHPRPGRGAHADAPVRISRGCAAVRPRAPWTRSGRVATRLETTRKVMTASPRPMSRCQVPMAATSASSGIGAAPPTA